MSFTVAVVPAGQWGTALAVPFARRGHRVRLWFRKPEAAAGFRSRRQNPRLPGITLPENVTATDDVAEAVDGADIIVIAPASRGLAAVCRRLAPHLPPGAVLVSAVKGLFAAGPALPSGIIARELPALASQIAVLSGPNFAVEVARELPAGTVVASSDPAVARFVQEALMTDRFRVWTSEDVIGVQLGGALKNVIAIGAGLSDGLGMGHNARAALITRGVAEITRLGLAMGANPLTFAGMSGIGDLILTCTSDLSRNRQAGLAVAAGETPEQYEARAGATVEGIPAAWAAHHLAIELGVEMPITAQVYRVLYEGLPPIAGVRQLMTREPTAELAAGRFRG
ncbi:MAG: NAD(P)-dependent glycerol-3-phosphate dehydrogenase [Firmicutes bacterium]|nr:NAD(P)-dependent glycerol-3-phosphate dehydrogenase [Bacillota bacterium]